ncbi:hypothetical protein OHA37_38170 [Streptomyces sp. NBC_00335]|uniref:hypothetical protein n=1 Tax=unclassified Streptomyces TaxID=2593676 RepID=UPI00225C02F3|nr:MULTISPECIES: hypothetical protein [unclassified Streptomyces]MCX5409673.1 hypothetical protein [Streptomyces sp. NBC_00086]
MLNALADNVLCGFCRATQEDGEARTARMVNGRLAVTWHAASCPHLAADRILAERE